MNSLDQSATGMCYLNITHSIFLVGTVLISWRLYLRLLVVSARQVREIAYI